MKISTYDRNEFTKTPCIRQNRRALNRIVTSESLVHWIRCSNFVVVLFFETPKQDFHTAPLLRNVCKSQVPGGSVFCALFTSTMYCLESYCVLHFWAVVTFPQACPKYYHRSEFAAEGKNKGHVFVCARERGGYWRYRVYRSW